MHGQLQLLDVTPRPPVAAPAPPPAVRPDTSTLLPFDQYDLFLVEFSGGKDSLACALRLLELGVPREKIELWHQCVDGDPAEENFLMEWPVTVAYVRAVARALGLRLRLQWKVGGFEGEMNRRDARTAPVTFELGDGSSKTVGGDRGKLSTREKFPQVSADLRVRWCSSYLKIMVSGQAICNDPELSDKKILVITGERREESASRSKYAEIERHRATNSRRRVDHYRLIIDWSEAEVWEIIRRWRIRPHPCYLLGFGRGSCMLCIFSTASAWASARELAPARVDRVAAYEQKFGLTVHRRLSVIQQADRGQSFVAEAPEELKRLALGTQYPVEMVFVPEGEAWELPAGAFNQRGGGPC